MLLSLMTALQHTDSSLEEAARMAGASPLRVFTDVTLPILKPAMISGAVTVFLGVSASFAVPAMIGRPANISLLTTRIYTLLRSGSLEGMRQAAFLSLLLLVVAVVTLNFQYAWARRYHIITINKKISRPSLIKPGGVHIPLNVLLTLTFLIFVDLPLESLLVSALSILPGTLSFENLGWGNFRTLFFETEETPRAVSNSLLAAASAATLAVFLGFGAAVLKEKSKLRFKSVPALLLALPYAVPGTVIAIALIFVFSRPLEVGPWVFSLYGTLGILIVAYMLKFASFSVQICSQNLSQIHPCLAEAAQISGAPWYRRVTGIWLPLSRPALVAAWFLIFMPALSELTMSILLYAPGTETVGTLLFQLQEYASPGSASVLALFLVAALVSGNLTIRTATAGRYGI
jgi:iron(III) transport system permease protein